MPLFNVSVSRRYTAYHQASILVEAADDVSAADALSAAMADSGDYDPESYRDLGQEEGYDDCDGWEVGGAEPVDPDRLWADNDGKCRVCGGHHDITPGCVGASRVGLVDD
jgi:hypothetical protein